MTIKPYALWIALCLACADALAAPPKLGRLFFTPEERATMDFERQTGQHAGRANKAEPPPAPKQININGLVIRGNGKNIVWINGSAQPHPGLRPDLQQVQGAEIPILIVNGEKQLLLKPGQSVITESGSVLEGFNRRPHLPGEARQ